MITALSHFGELPLFIRLAIIAWFILLVSFLFILLDIGKRVWYNVKRRRTLTERLRRMQERGF